MHGIKALHPRIGTNLIITNRKETTRTEQDVDLHIVIAVLVHCGRGGNGLGNPVGIRRRKQPLNVRIIRPIIAVVRAQIETPKIPLKIAAVGTVGLAIAIAVGEGHPPKALAFGGVDGGGVLRLFERDDDQLRRARVTVVAVAEDRRPGAIVQLRDLRLSQDITEFGHFIPSNFPEDILRREGIWVGDIEGEDTLGPTPGGSNEDTPPARIAVAVVVDVGVINADLTIDEQLMGIVGLGQFC